MDHLWPIVRLGKLLIQSEQTIDVDLERAYKQVTVRLWGKGVCLRDQVLGSEIAGSKRYQVKGGQFILSKIDARNGAFGLVPQELDGAIVSGDFPHFDINPDRLAPRYLEWLSKTRSFVELCRAASEGTTNRVRLKEDRFLRLKIPLPPLPEQRRIVAKIEEANKLREYVNTKRDLLLQSTINDFCFSYEYPIKLFGDVLLEAKNGIYKPPHYWGRGIPCIRMYNIDGPTMNVNNLQNLDVTKYEFDIYGCKPGDLIFNRVNSAELVGKTGIITKDYPSCTFESKNMRLRVDQNQTLPEYAVLILNSVPTKQFYRDVLKQQCGMATLNQNHVSSIPYPLPPIEEQRRIVTYLDGFQAQVDALKKLQAQTAAQLDALLPAILDRAFKGEL